MIGTLRVPGSEGSKGSEGSEISPFGRTGARLTPQVGAAYRRQVV